MSAGRKPLAVGTYGEIAVKKQPSGKWRASTQFRDGDGVTRGVERRGDSKAAAKNNLKVHLLERQAPSRGAISGDMSIEKLLELWVAKLRFEKSKRPQSIANDESIVRAQIVPRIGGLKIREVSVPVLDQMFMAPDMSLSNARLCKIALSGAMQLAVSHGAIPSNPVRDTTRIPKNPTEVLKMEVDQIVVLRSAIDAYEGSNRLGPKRNVDNLRDVVNFLFATGFRINEALAVRWQDIDWERNTVTVTGTLFYVKGEGINRQPSPKTRAGFREVVVPEFGMDVLRRRRDNQPPNDLDAVFVTAKGTWISANNLRTKLRAVRDTVNLDFVAPHILRKTVASLLEGDATMKDATAQLGHESERTTAASYVKRAMRAPDNSSILAKLGPAYVPEDA